jgi:sarcosine oxidase subunit beta
MFDRESHSVELPGREPLPPRASVTIIGGGVMGVSTALHLARAGVGGIVVLEQNLLGSGSSAKPLGVGSGNVLRSWQHLVGATQPRSLRAIRSRVRGRHRPSAGRIPVLCRTENELAAVASSAELQNRLGGWSEMVSPGRAAQLNPFIDPSVLLGASFSPRDGYAQPGQVVHGYVDTARSLGVVFSEHTEVTAIDTDDDTVTAVRANRGLVRTDTVICAAGAWSQPRSARWE